MSTETLKHPYNLAINQSYIFTLAATTFSITGVFQGTNDLGFWVVKKATGHIAINPDLVVAFRGAQ